MLDSFETPGPRGKHFCLVYRPLGMSFTEFRNSLPGKVLPKNLLHSEVCNLRLYHSFLYTRIRSYIPACFTFTQIQIIETMYKLTKSKDISSNNIMQGIMDNKILSEIEEDEINRQIARKVLDDRHINYS